MTRLFAISSLALIVAMLVACDPNKDCGEVRGRSLLTRCLVIPEAEFTEDLLSARARGFLAEVSGQRAFGRLELVSKESDVPLASGARATDLDDAWWFSEYEKRRHDSFPVAVVTVISGECALQMRDRLGRIKKVVLTKHDPLVISVGTHQYELLHVLAFRGDDDQYQRSYGGEPIRVVAYLEAEDDSGVTSNPDLWLSLHRLLGLRAMDVRVARNHWFPEAGNFPVVYPFRPAVPPPPLNEIYRTPQSWCGSVPGTLRCGRATLEKTEYANFDLQGKPQPE